jgi:uncharacterized cupredoxin-like copper-binding protein
VLTAICVATVVLASGIAVGCGEDEEGTTTTTPTTPLAGETPPSKVAISLTEFKLDPANPEVAAGTVNFAVSNDGGVTHSLEVEGPGGESELEKPLEPGQSATLTVDLSKPGSYEFYCPVGNHKEMGMEGEVTVNSGGGAGAPSTTEDEGTTVEDEGGSNRGPGGGGGGGGY